MRKVGSFIDDVMVGTESKEEYDELVKEIFMRIEKNDLYKDRERKSEISVRLASI